MKQGGVSGVARSLGDIAAIAWTASRIAGIRRTGAGRFAQRPKAWHSVGVAAELVAALITLTTSYQAEHDAVPVPRRTVAAAPPGRTVMDDGRAFGGRGGSSRFTVAIDPANTWVRLTRRLDAGIAMQTASISVDGVPAGVWPPLPREPIYHWKDQRVDIPPRLTAGRRSLTITNTFASSTWDFNEFAYFVDQRVHGVWSRAAVVDVGPGHPADEARYHYRITGQTWAGRQTFKYER